MIYEMHVKL